MNILFLSAEVAPFAKVGGLADVAGALPKALRELGHDCRVLMPLYKMIEEDPRWQLTETLPSFSVPINESWTKPARFLETEHEGVPFGFIGTDEWFPAADRSESVYQPGGLQWIFFAEALVQAMERLDWVPDVIHVNDWHMGFVPVILREKHPKWNQVGTAFTIHNLAYQGEFDLRILDAAGLPHTLYTYDKLETWGRVNFLKSGMVYSDQVNTVSPTYAKEIQTQTYGCTLDGLNRHLAKEGRLEGILNGIDLDVFDPATDLALAANFRHDDLAGKAICRAALLEEIGMDPLPKTPVVGVVSRLSEQKGMDLMLEVAHLFPEMPMQLVVLGVGDPKLAQGFRHAQGSFIRNVRFLEAFDLELAQRVYAGCDAFLMPSTFEPCGLGQQIAMRYGTVPVVRKTGGLADTVFEGENGFTFDERSPEAMAEALRRMVAAYRKPKTWSKLVQKAITGDYGWEKSAEHYVRMYEHAVNRRRPAVRKEA